MPQNKPSQTIASVPSGRYATTTDRQTNNNDNVPTMCGRITGYAYDLVTYAYDTIAHVQELTGMNVRDYMHADVKSHVPIVNVTATNYVFVAIGFRASQGDIRCPVLAHCVGTDKWVYARNVVWYADEHGFTWDNGTYTDEQHARDLFKKGCTSVIYCTEAY